MRHIAERDTPSSQSSGRDIDADLGLSVGRAVCLLTAVFPLMLYLWNQVALQISGSASPFLQLPEYVPLVSVAGSVLLALTYVYRRTAVIALCTITPILVFVVVISKPDARLAPLVMLGAPLLVPVLICASNAYRLLALVIYLLGFGLLLAGASPDTLQPQITIRVTYTVLVIALPILVLLRDVRPLEQRKLAAYKLLALAALVANATLLLLDANSAASAAVGVWVSIALLVFLRGRETPSTVIKSLMILLPVAALAFASVLSQGLVVYVMPIYVLAIYLALPSYWAALCSIGMLVIATSASDLLEPLVIRSLISSFTFAVLLSVVLGVLEGRSTALNIQSLLGFQRRLKLLLGSATGVLAIICVTQVPLLTQGVTSPESRQWLGHVTFLGILWTLLTWLVFTFVGRLAAAEQNLLSRIKKQRKMFGIVSHEIRTPAAAIETALNLLSDKAPYLNDEDLSRAIASSKRLVNVVDDLRLAINPNVELPLKSRQFSMKELLDELRAKVTRLNNGASCFIEMSLPETYLERYFADDYRICYLVAALLRRRVYDDYASNLKLEIKLLTVEQNEKSSDDASTTRHDLLLVTIEDDGEQLLSEELTDDLARNKLGSADLVDSNVLLQTLRQWTRQLGGEITFAAPTHGRNQVVITLALERALSDAEYERLAQINLEFCRRQLRGRCILLVEDDPMIRALVAKQLSGWLNLSVSTAVDGLDGLARFHELTPDLVFTDYFMPKKDGRELIADLREASPQLKIVAFTAATIGTEMADLEAAGADIVVTKPLSRDVLLYELAALLRARDDVLLAGQLRQ